MSKVQCCDVYTGKQHVLHSIYCTLRLSINYINIQQINLLKVLVINSSVSKYNTRLNMLFSPTPPESGARGLGDPAMNRLA